MAETALREIPAENSIDFVTDVMLIVIIIIIIIICAACSSYSQGKIHLL